MWLRACLVLGVVLMSVACDDDDPVVPEVGTIVVEVATAGDGTDEDGFTVDLDSGAETEDVDVDGTATLDNVAAGDHSVELTGLASNCTVDGDNPQTVTVESGGEETVTFAVTCTVSS